MPLGGIARARGALSWTSGALGPGPQPASKTAITSSMAAWKKCGGWAKGKDRILRDWGKAGAFAGPRAAAFKFAPADERAFESAEDGFPDHPGQQRTVGQPHGHDEQGGAQFFA